MSSTSFFNTYFSFFPIFFPLLFRIHWNLSYETKIKEKDLKFTLLSEFQQSTYRLLQLALKSVQDQRWSRQTNHRDCRWSGGKRPGQKTQVARCKETPSGWPCYCRLVDIGIGHWTSVTTINMVVYMFFSPRLESNRTSKKWDGVVNTNGGW